MNRKRANCKFAGVPRPAYFKSTDEWISTNSELLKGGTANGTSMDARIIEYNQTQL